MAKLTLFSQATAAMLTSQALARSRQSPDRPRRKTGRSDPTPPFWIELIEEDEDNPGRYSWKKVTPVDGELTDTDPLIDSGGLYTARDINGCSGLPAGTRVEVKFAGYDSTAEGDDKPPVYLFCFDRMPGELFVVNLSMDGGAAGDGSGPATWTYTVTSLDGVELGTAMSPQRPRDSFGEREEAGKGTGYYDASGTFKLAEAWETIPVEPCED